MFVSLDFKRYWTDKVLLLRKTFHKVLGYFIFRFKNGFRLFYYLLLNPLNKDHIYTRGAAAGLSVCLKVWPSVAKDHLKSRTVTTSTHPTKRIKSWPIENIFIYLVSSFSCSLIKWYLQRAKITIPSFTPSTGWSN